MRLKTLIDFYNNKSHCTINDVIHFSEYNEIRCVMIQSLHDNDRIIMVKYLKLFGEIKMYIRKNYIEMLYIPSSKS